MTTVQDLTDRALRPMRDADQSFFTPNEMIEYVNEAMNDLCARQLCRLLTDVEVFTDLVGSIQPPDSLFLRWEEIRDVTIVTESAWRERRDTDYDQTDAQIGMLAANAVYILPVPALNTSYLVSYYALHEQLDATADGFPMDVIYEQKVVNYMRSKCYMRLGEESLAGSEMAMYERGLRPARGLETPKPGPWTLSREVGIFDNDPEVSHLGFTNQSA